MNDIEHTLENTALNRIYISLLNFKGHEPHANFPFHSLIQYLLPPIIGQAPFQTIQTQL